MSDQQFNTLWNAALKTDDRSAFVSEWSRKKDGAPIPPDPEDLERLWDAAHMSVRYIQEYSAMTQEEFALCYCIPLQTLKDWATGRAVCPDYLRLLLAQAAGAYERP